MGYLSVRDTFATFLSEQLTANSIPFHWYLMDSEDPNQERLKLNCVNIYFLVDSALGPLERTMVSVDIINTSERTALKWQDTVTTQILRREGIIPNMDYSITPDNPTTNYGTIHWDIRDISWTNVQNDNYVHYNATFDLIHIIPVV